VLVSTSVSHPQATLQGGIRATHLASFFLIEPLDNEHCRLTHLFRVDMRWAWLVDKGVWFGFCLTAH